MQCFNNSIEEILQVEKDFYIFLLLRKIENFQMSINSVV